ncbi:MAG: hypothetical protein VXZ32_08925 [Verrucomicrobiota bacterium]|nr:hypothetical protein [Verrucomicrobiota bacterium]
MTKISFDVDFNQDPQKILEEIQKRAEAEVAKRESKEKESSYLSKLHEVVNKEIGTDFKNINALIRALTKYATPGVRDKILQTSPSGRRKTISMSKEIFQQIKSLLAEPNPNKAAIARETGVSVVQVRKVADGGYDGKFGDSSGSSEDASLAKPLIDPVVKKEDSPALSPISEETAEKEETSLPPPPPAFESEDAPATEEPSPSLPPVENLPEMEEEAPPANLAPPPSFGEESTEPPAPPADLPPPPSFGEESTEPPPPPADLPPPPLPPVDESPIEAPEPEPTAAPEDLPAAPPPPPAAPLPAAKPLKPSLSGKSGKPTLSLKPGKSKTKGLKLTRPPLKKNLPPPS